MTDCFYLENLRNVLQNEVLWVAASHEIEKIYIQIQGTTVILE